MGHIPGRRLRAQEAPRAFSPGAGRRHLLRLPGRLKLSSMWNSAGSGFVVRSRSNRVTTVWKPCASITVHCLSAKVEASKTSEICAVAAKRRLVLDLDRDRIAFLGDAQDPCVARHVDVVGKEKLQRRLGDEILVLRIELVVDDGDAAAVGDDLEARRVGVLEQHAAWARDAQRSLRALSVRSDLNEVGCHDARRVQPGVGARHRFGGGEGRRGGVFGGFGGFFRRRMELDRLILRERRRASGESGPDAKRRQTKAFRHEVKILVDCRRGRRIGVRPMPPTMGDIPCGRKRQLSGEPCAPSVAGSRPSRG